MSAIGSSKMSVNLENIIAEIGGFGNYQKIMLVFICLIFVPLGFFVFAPVFTYITPPHRCFIPAIDQGASNPTSNNSVLEAFIPYANPEAGDLELARCLRFTTESIVATMTNGTTNDTWFRNETITSPRGTEGCLDGWVYMDPEGRVSATTEFNLVCENAWKKPLLTSGLIVGLFLGSIVSGPLTDRFGRRIICIVNLFLNVALTTIYSFTPIYEILVVTIIITGISHIILYCCTFVLAQELVDRKHRALVSCLVNVVYATGIMLLPGVAYLLKDWRWILRSLAVTTILYLPYIFFLPESPRWLVSRGRYQDAYKLLDRMARWNKSSTKILDDLKTNNISLEGAPLQQKVTTDGSSRRRRRHSSVQIIATNSVMRRRSFIVCCVWNISFLCYYALGYNTSNLGGNNYWNCFIAAALEIPSHFLVAFSIQRIGRRFSIAGYLGLAGAFCGLTPAFGAYNAASVSFAMVGKFFATSSMGILYLYTTELYPTLLRNTGVGIASMSSRLSSICAPFLVFAGENAGKYIPFYVMCALGIATSVLCLLLPETMQSALPDTIEDAENLEKFRIFSSSSKKHRKQKESLASLTTKESSRIDEIAALDAEAETST